MQGWQNVYSSTSLQEISLIKSMLLEMDIPSIILNQKDSSHIHIGEIKLFVKQEDCLTAKNKIAKFKS